MVYGSAKPPPYDLSRISSPMYIYYSQTDNLVTPKVGVGLHQWHREGSCTAKFKLRTHFD